MTSNTKDVAIATAYFMSHMEAHQSFFNCIDKCYEMAVSFVEKYPPWTEWGIEIGTEYEEVLYKFYIENF